jgi:arginyl-tRNA synthetase
MKNELTGLLQKIIQEFGVTDVVPEVKIIDDATHGDYTTNIAMRLSKQLKKSPMDIALQVQEELNKRKNSTSHKNTDHNISKVDHINAYKFAGNDVLQDIEAIEVAQPGFINFTMAEAMLSTQLIGVLKQRKAYGTGRSDISQKVVVEFTDPNPFKEFHIGHLYSNSVGESVSRLLESQGHTVRRVCYQGDVGMHVAKALFGLLQIPDVEKKLESLVHEPLADRAKFMGQAYVVGARAFEEDSTAAESMKALNRLGFIAAQAMWVKEKGITPIINYRNDTAIDEAELQKVSTLYVRGRAWSLEYFETIYRRLGTIFEGYYFESFVGELGAKLVRDHVADGVFEQSDGAIIYRGEKKGLHTRVFINKLGLPTYEAKELGLAPTKQSEWPYDRSIIVTGNEINEYFKVLLAALSEISPELAIKTKHMGHGMVRKSDGSKMSSRSGVVLTGEGLLDEVKESVYTLLDKSTSKYTADERENIAERAAVAAVKYSLLRVSLPSDVAFDISTSVSFEGDSGPYLLYTYARCQSVLRKSGSSPQDLKSVSTTMNQEEKSIARMISFYPEIVTAVATDLTPNVLCTYLFELAQLFNAFYAKHQILEGESKDLRLLLTTATAQVLQNGLGLLGIETVERM